MRASTNPYAYDLCADACFCEGFECFFVSRYLSFCNCKPASQMDAWASRIRIAPGIFLFTDLREVKVWKKASENRFRQFFCTTSLPRCQSTYSHSFQPSHPFVPSNSRIKSFPWTLERPAQILQNAPWLQGKRLLESFDVEQNTIGNQVTFLKFSQNFFAILLSSPMQNCQSVYKSKVATNVEWSNPLA